MLKGRPKSEHAAPAWPAYLLAGLLALGATLLTGLAPYTAPPVLGRPTGVIFPPFSNTISNFNALLTADPRALLVDSWYGDRVIFIVSDSPDFQSKLRQAGAIHSFDAIAAGCHIEGIE